MLLYVQYTINMEIADCTKSWTSQAEFCRFCLTTNGTLDLFATYITEAGQKEIYSKIILDCFGLAITLSPGGRLSCDGCVGRLRDALAFRKQVLGSEEVLTAHSEIARSSYCLGSDVKNDDTKPTDAESSIGLNVENEVPYSEESHEVEPYAEDHTVYNTSTAPCKKPALLSERKRLKITCDTILRDTTACPFRHHKSWFRCFFCTQSFLDIPSLRVHTTQTHSDIDSQIKQLKRYPRSLQIDITELHCHRCNIHLTDVDALSVHFKSVHEKMIYKECIADFKLSTSPYSCHLCSEQFHVFRTLTTHLNVHYANYICAVCGKSFLNSKRLKVHDRTHESGLFPCAECGKVLRTRSSQASHAESHAKRVLTCQICSKPMKHYNDRVKHMSSEHNITHTFKCPVCAREYNVKHYLATHMRQTHGHKDNKCGECGMAFVTSHGLKKHMQRHAGKKYNKK